MAENAFSVVFATIGAGEAPLACALGPELAGPGDCTLADFVRPLAVSFADRAFPSLAAEVAPPFGDPESPAPAIICRKLANERELWLGGLDELAAAF